jgi:hypothetical protein
MRARKLTTKREDAEYARVPAITRWQARTAVSEWRQMIKPRKGSLR